MITYPIDTVSTKGLWWILNTDTNELSKMSGTGNWADGDGKQLNLPPNLVPLLEVEEEPIPSTGNYIVPSDFIIDIPNNEYRRQWVEEAIPDSVQKEIDFRATIEAGYVVEPEGFSIGMDEQDRKNFSEYTVLMNEAQNLGMVTDNTLVTIHDIEGNEQELTLSRFRQIVVGMGIAYKMAFDIK